MKNLVLLILLLGAFLGGYYARSLPGSPDIFAWGRRSYQQGADLYRKVSGAADAETDEPAQPAGTVQPAEPDSMLVRLDGRTYVIGLADRQEVP